MVADVDRDPPLSTLAMSVSVPAARIWTSARKPSQPEREAARQRRTSAMHRTSRAIALLLAALGAPSWMLAASAGNGPSAGPTLATPAPANAEEQLKQAQALGYAEDATKVKHAAFKAGSNCANCNFYKGAKGSASGPCTLFPKNSVVSKGWCSAWAKKV